MAKKEMKVRLTFTEEMLGTTPMNEEVYREFIASKSPDAATIEDEVEALGVDAVAEKGMTGFPKLDDGTPFLYDYQVKGFFKDACGMLRRLPDSESKKLTSYKKVIDGLIFVNERKIPIISSGAVGNCERSLRAQTAQGERTSLASSETVKSGSYIEFTICMLDGRHEGVVREWLDYGTRRGIGQWRNSGKGSFEWEEVA